MRPLPFKLKIALLSLLLSGGVVVGFGGYFVAVIHDLGRDRLDREIRALAEGQLHGHHPASYWRDFDRSVRFVYGETSASRPMVRVEAVGGPTLFVSEGFPAELVAELPAPSEAVLSRPPAGRPPARSPMGGPPRREREGFVARLDRDGDVRVSREEFDGPSGEFDRFDANGDGGVTEAEARRAGESRASAPVGPGFPGGLEAPPRLREPVFRTVKTPAGSWRVGVLGNDDVFLTVALDLAELGRESDRFRNAFLVAVPVALLGLVVGGWWLAHRALAPVSMLTATAERITAEGLGERISVPEADPELRRLIEVINGMLGSLERSFGQATRFSADAAHELRTPLTVLQGELEQRIQDAAPGSEEQQAFEALLEEVRRLTSVVRKLLLLSRADAGRLDLRRERLELGPLLEPLLEDVEAMAPELEIETRIAPGVAIEADRELVGQLLRNLTTNAVVHHRVEEPSGDRARLSVELGSSGGSARLTIRNSAPPIPEDAAAQIFDRFYRLDGSRERGGGSGLGLSLAREIARAHGGELSLGSYRDSQVSFVLSLPLATGDSAR